MDSDAGVPVAITEDFPGWEVTESPGFLESGEYVGLSGEQIAMKAKLTYHCALKMADTALYVSSSSST